jgi:uncharacterized protein with FMN-binding domain
MARGAQKQQAQQKNAEKKAKDAKSGSQKDAQKAGLKVTCKVCMAPMTNYNVLKQHYDAKHPKEACPDISEFQ